MERQSDQINRRLKIAFAGAGNVATHLAKALDLADGVSLTGIASRNLASAQTLASALKNNTPEACSYKELKQLDFDVLIVSVADHAIPTVAERIGPLASNPLVLVTSGTVSCQSFITVSPRVGVLYPFQTFTRGFDVVLDEVPFFIESGSDKDLELIECIAKILSPKVYYADENRRQYLHIAGVFSSNFVNALIGAAIEQLRKADLPERTIEPLMRQTLDKALALGAINAQTGPAKRRDVDVMESQKQKLNDLDRRVYTTMSELIINQQAKNNEQN